MESKENSNSIEELKKLIEAEDENKRKLFYEEYEKLSNKYGFDFSAKPTILEDGRLSAILGIIKVEQKKNKT